MEQGSKDGNECSGCVSHAVGLYSAHTVGEGTAINSASEEITLNGLRTKDAKERMTAWLETKGLGKKTTNYKLRDWVFSRKMRVMCRSAPRL